MEKMISNMGLALAMTLALGLGTASAAGMDKGAMTPMDDGMKQTAMKDDTMAKKPMAEGTMEPMAEGAMEPMAEGAMEKDTMAASDSMDSTGEMTEEEMMKLKKKKMMMDAAMSGDKK